ncbi:phosphatidylserine/phosphatidylglycerophosphate/cardiolipin synthase family protein [Prescottella agglutinans]|uniref:phospholipase D n=1 Tax=Prescottella agglutinans TaxID=1644129 RepID=A0A438BGP1_9NOCA|nr:phosphatidylserine/phosphatidylglycerophosphate/cardiolipin synthase family protein [Prescottella agglutinans]
MDPMKACTLSDTTPVQTKAVFNDPVSGDPAAIMAELCSLIRQAPAGSQIRIAHFVVSGTVGDDFADVIIDAQRRGVDIQMVLDGWQDDKPPAQRILQALGTDKNQPSWLHVCSNVSPEGNTSSCLGTKGNHNKFALFGETGGKRNVVMQSSSNLTDVNSRTYWNNAVVLDGNDRLFETYGRYFTELAAESRTEATLGRIHTDMPGGPVEVYFSPVPEGDPVLDQLAGLTCGSSTRIGVAMSEMDDTRVDIVDRLVALSREGCDVRIVHGTIGTEGAARLAAEPSIEVRTLNDSELPGRVHSKYMVVDHGSVGLGSADLGSSGTATGWVTTGSQNWNHTSLRRNDEATLTLHQPAMVDEYTANFEHVFSVARPTS